MIRLALLALAASALPALAQVGPRQCTDLALTLETNHSGGMRVVTGTLRNLGGNAFASATPSTLRVVWHGENGQTLDFPLPGALAVGAQSAQVLGMWPDAMHGTLHATLQLAPGATADCNRANNGMRLAL